MHENAPIGRTHFHKNGNFHFKTRFDTEAKERDGGYGLLFILILIALFASLSRRGLGTRIVSRAKAPPAKITQSKKSEKGLWGRECLVSRGLHRVC